MRLVVATRNEHKLRELVAPMRPHELDPLPDEIELPPETGTTFADNAQIMIEIRGTGPSGVDGIMITSGGNTLAGLSLFNIRRSILLASAAI